MPYPNFHSCRLNDPGKYSKIRYKKQNGADVVMGQKEGGGWEVQAIRYPKGSFSADEARKSCSSHGGSFEAARSHSLDQIEEWPESENLPECFTSLELPEHKSFSRTIKNQEIFAVGKWHGDQYTAGDLDEMVRSFYGLGWDIPLKLGHDEAQRWFGQKDGSPALGWLSNVRRAGDKLVADFINVPEAIAKLIENKNYRHKSSEVFWGLEANGQTWPRALKAVSLLGADLPAVTTLNELQTALMSTEVDYTIETWPSDGKGESKWYTWELKQEDKMDKEQEKVYTDRIADLEAKLTAEKKRGDDAEAKAVSAEADLKKRDETFAIQQFVAKLDTLIKEGKVAPAEKEGLERQFSALGAGTRKYADKEFNPREDLVKSLETRAVKFHIGKEHGKGGETEETGEESAVVKVDKLARKYAAEHKYSYSDGLQRVKTEDPDLWYQYLAESGGKK